MARKLILERKEEPAGSLKALVLNDLRLPVGNALCFIAFQSPFYSVGEKEAQHKPSLPWIPVSIPQEVDAGTLSRCRSYEVPPQ